MKYFYAILIIIFNLAVIPLNSIAKLSSEYKGAIYDIFPSLHNFVEEKNNWLDSSIIEEDQNTYTVLKKTYTYYSKSPQVIFDIKREPTFSVDVTLYITKDYKTADQLFNDLQKHIKYKYKKEINFGQSSFFYIDPIDTKSLKANFYTFTKNQNFIIKIASNDGFSIMDFTEYISNNLANFIYQNIDIYSFNRLRVKCTVKDIGTQMNDILLLNKNYKTILIEGFVKNNNLNPIQNATVELLELGIKTTTDSNGHFMLSGNLGKSGEDVRLTKNFIFGEINEDISPYNFELYRINMVYNSNKNKENDVLYLKLNNNIESYGEIYSTNNKKIDPARVTKHDKTIQILRDCSTSLFSCKQKFEGELDENGIKGTWEGFGGGGTFIGDKITDVTKETINLKSGICSIGVLIKKESGEIHKSYVGSLYSYIYPDERSYVYINCNPNNKQLFFLKDAFLELNYLPQQELDAVKLLLYYGKINDGKLEIVESRKEYNLTNASEPTRINLNITDYLIDRQYANKSLLIGPAGNGPISLLFGGLTSQEEARPRIVLHNFNIFHNNSLKSSISAKLCESQDKDYASNSNKPSPDGKSDLCISFSFNNINGVLKNMVITYKSTFDFVWNLKEDDIYPGIVFVKNNKFFDTKNYNIQGTDSFNIYLAKPDFFDNTGTIEYSIYINDKLYRGSIPLGH
jgi:hypothetical protein